jgi:tellurite resistance-related uncharacterized protein
MTEPHQIEPHEIEPPPSAGARELPDDLVLVRTTPEFTDRSVPAGLLRAHRVADGTWGRILVRKGSVRFVFEEPPTEGEPCTSHDLSAGDSLVIPPRTAHRVEPAEGSQFVVEFHTAASHTAEPRTGEAS